jgi:hypothetical protein
MDNGHKQSSSVVTIMYVFIITTIVMARAAVAGWPAHWTTYR